MTSDMTSSYTSEFRESDLYRIYRRGGPAMCDFEEHARQLIIGLERIPPRRQSSASTLSPSSSLRARWAQRPSATPYDGEMFGECTPGFEERHRIWLAEQEASPQAVLADVQSSPTWSLASDFPRLPMWWWHQSEAVRLAGPEVERPSPGLQVALPASETSVTRTERKLTSKVKRTMRKWVYPATTHHAHAPRQTSNPTSVANEQTPQPRVPSTYRETMEPNNEVASGKSWLQRAVGTKLRSAVCAMAGTDTAER